ncbi:hypothetical protein D915_002529 [Fasciola hepatica]|uniref:Amino acid transporter transmembrane domain-containing protein n=1 Tax=Fasciola hepatica TaxID=6192 RepID=A0A2H1CMY2_FASHE|nr:hypothetical protein D915_002529 [Fasciola hepatica]
MIKKRNRSVSEEVKSSTPQQHNPYGHPSVVQLHRSYQFGAGEIPVRSDEFAVTAIHFGSAQNDSGRMETVMSLGDQSTGYNYSRSQGGARGQSLLSQTWKSGLHHLPARSFVSSLTSAYSIIDRRRGDESSLTAEVEEEEGEQASRGSEGGDGDREVLPLVAESGEVRQWSVYDNACRTTSVWVSGWNVTNLVQGVGVLAVPYACFQAGWMCLPIVILIAAIACYTGHMVGECLYDNPRLMITGYRELHRTRVRSTMSCIAAHAIPRGGQHFTGALVLLDMFGAAILYLLLLGRSSAEIFEPLLHAEWPLSYWIVVGGCLQVPVVLCPGIHIIAWFSMIAMISLHSCILIGIIYCAQEVGQNSLQGMYLPPPNIENLPVAISIIVFSYAAHAALPGIEGSMKQPDYFPKMLNVAFSLASALKLTFGLLCAIVIGSRIKDSVAECMGNRPVLSFVMNSFVMISVFFSSPLFFHILGEQVDSAVAPYVRRGFLSNRTFLSIYTCWFMSTRCAILALALLIAVLVPFFATIIGFLGAISGCLLLFILPCSFHLILFWYSLCCSAKICRFCIIIFGIAFGILGLIASSYQVSKP